VRAKRPLRRHGRLHGIGGAREGGKERVTLRIDLAPIVLDGRAAQQSQVLLERAGVALAQLPQQLR